MKRHSKKVPGIFPAPNPASRPKHKEDVHLRAVQVTVSKKLPEPMSLMHKREKNKEVVPDAQKGSATRGQIEQAAHAMAAWDNSDPFAYGRMALYVSQGYVLSNDIVTEMSQRVVARKAAKRREVDNAKSIKIGA